MICHFFLHFCVTLVTQHSRGFTHVKFVDAAQMQTWSLAGTNSGVKIFNLCFISALFVVLV